MLGGGRRVFERPSRLVREAEQGAVWMARGAWSFLAVARWWSRRSGRAPLVWIPDFFCNPSLEPLRRSGAQLTFYPIAEDLRPDPGPFAALAATARPDIVVVVHYFGIPMDFSPILGQLDRSNQLVFEDAAHVLRPAAGIGTHGDFVLYCPHKHLGIPHGAVLLSRDQAVAARLQAELSDSGVDAPSVGSWCLRKAAQSMLPDAVRRRLRSIPDHAFLDDYPASAVGHRPQMSRAARKLLEGADVEGLAQNRRLADAALREALSHVDGWRAVADYWGDAAPYRTVMRCDDERIASARYSLFRRAGYPVEAWGAMAPEVKANPHAHAAARRLRATLIEFPFDVSRPAAAASLARRALREVGAGP